MLLNSDDRELRRLSKQANQRIVRLERYQEKEGLGYTPAYEQARFYLNDKTVGKMRFQENPSRLTEEQKKEQLFKVTAFLNNPLSQVKAIKNREKIRRDIEKQGLEIPDDKGLFDKLVLQKPDSEKEEKQFWQLFDTAKAQGLVKAFDYRTISKIISWKLAERSDRVFRRIAEWMLNIENVEKKNRKQLFEEIGAL